MIKVSKNNYNIISLKTILIVPCIFQTTKPTKNR